MFYGDPEKDTTWKSENWEKSDFFINFNGRSTWKVVKSQIHMLKYSPELSEICGDGDPVD